MLGCPFGFPSKPRFQAGNCQLKGHRDLKQDEAKRLGSGSKHLRSTCAWVSRISQWRGIETELERFFARDLGVPFLSGHSNMAGSPFGSPVKPQARGTLKQRHPPHMGLFPNWGAIFKIGFSLTSLKKRNRSTGLKGNESILNCRVKGTGPFVVVFLQGSRTIGSFFHRDGLELVNTPF